MAIASQRKVKSLYLAICTFVLIVLPLSSFASNARAADKDESIGTAIAQVESMIAGLESGNLESSSEAFSAVKKWWTANKKTVKENSLEMSLEIDRQIANLSLAILNKDVRTAKDEAGALQFSLKNYSDGAYTDNKGNSGMTLSAYVVKLQQAAELMKREFWPEALNEVKLLQRQWLSVEGDIVSQSQTVYNRAESDLVLLDAYLSSPDKRSQALPVIERLIDSLTPFIGAQYSWWDAALIPIREGIEGLLVVGTLLMYAKRSNSVSAKRWVIGGSLTGAIACIAVGLAVAFLISSSAFGHNNSLINGWTGVFASVLLLYVSYWLHRNADMKRWNQFLQLKSSQALTGGKMISLALLAFFAIMREGLETVIFLVGMAGKMPGGHLAGGIAAGFGVLAVCAAVMIKLGTRLPVRPVFLVSSVIVFYLCFKFMGSGIHSLQMAGVVPSTVQDYLPEAATFSLYPSWYSTLPQLLFIVIAAAAVVYQRNARNKRNAYQNV
ncbi:FTR1 family iron permease [Paenibacillus contaminans]|uniref:Iron permease FTR1 family protein n=1 Tax=Paenibacillus contaminans TaxID=450362 RepID=A0A329MUI2_9BACL|nr:FTR1 family protein [Paenibacillus contaminans]RAV21617.1 iron permease FTR1 family protein [Paenibacillus contaminans]